MRPALLNLLTVLTIGATVLVGGAALFLVVGAPPSLRLDLRPPTQVPATTSTDTPIPPTDTPPPPTQTPTPRPSATSSATSTPFPTPTEVLSPTAGPRLVLGPYLQMPSPDEMLLVWETDRASLGEVVFGPTEAYGSLARDTPDPNARHAVRLQSLTPGTTYHYQVLAGGNPLTPDRAFRAPPIRAAGPLRVAVYGDTQSGHDTHRAVIGQVIRWDPDLVLHAGDLVAHGTSLQEWLTFFDIEDPLLRHTPLLTTLGNHEAESDLYFSLFHLPGNERWYSFSIGPALFISLELDDSAAFAEGSEQYDWLKDTLEKRPSKWIIVWGHIPPHSAWAEDSDETDIREALGPLFEAYGVDVVLSGHHHDFQRYVIEGVTYIVTGGGGGELLPITHTEDGMRAYANEAHFTGLVIRDDTLTGDALAPGGEVLDHFILNGP